MVVSLRSLDEPFPRETRLGFYMEYRDTHLRKCGLPKRSVRHALGITRARRPH